MLAPASRSGGAAALLPLVWALSGFPGCGGGEGTTFRDGDAGEDGPTAKEGGTGGPDGTGGQADGADGSTAGDVSGSEGGLEDGPVAGSRPLAAPLRVSVEVGSVVSGQLPGTAGPGRALSYLIARMPGSGTITAFDPATGAFTYQDSGLAPGADAFEFQVSDGEEVSDPARVDITIAAFDFTGWYTLPRAGCSDATMLIVHEADRLSISARSFQCGSQTTTFNLGESLTIQDGELLSGSKKIGTLTATSITLSDSRYVSGCGTARAHFELHRQVDGFAHVDQATAPCVATQDFSTTPSYRPMALLRTDGDHDFGVVAARATVAHGFTFRNVGKVAATMLAPLTPPAPFGYAGGAYPGEGGDCGSELAPKASCRLVGAATPTAPTAPDRISGAVGVQYSDPAGRQTTAAVLSLAVTPSLMDLVDVAAGGAFRCTRDASGVLCWGDSSKGQTEVPDLTAPAQIEAGFAHACAIDGTALRCWGDNTSGQTTVPPLTAPTLVAAGYGHTCALDGSVTCWGSPSNNALQVPALTNPRRISSLHTMTCALDDTGVVCWGGNIAVTAPPLMAPTSVSAGTSHACALDATGVVCFGNNTWGRVTVPPLVNPRMVSAGADHTCAIDDTGVVCWGNPARTQVPAMTSPTFVSAGYYQTCAIDGQSVVCW
jgi:hypothetical protein